MLHLLTEEHRKKVVTEYRKRVVIVLLLGLLCVSAISAVFILPTFFLSYGKYSLVLAQQKALDSEIAIKEERGSSESIKNVTLSIEALKMFESGAGSKDTSLVLESIVKAKPAGVQIMNFVFTPGDGSALTVDIAGRADTRKSLVQLDQNLKSNPLFDSVAIPLSNFAKDKDIMFSAKMLVSTSTLPVAAGTGLDMSAGAVSVLASSSAASSSAVAADASSTASSSSSKIKASTTNEKQN